MKAKARGDIAQERAIFDVRDLIGFHVRDVQGKTINVKVGFADVNESGNDEEVDEVLKVEPPDAVLSNLATFIADSRR
jgi:hypothetical protein